MGYGNLRHGLGNLRRGLGNLIIEPRLVYMHTQKPQKIISNVR